MRIHITTGGHAGPPPSKAIPEKHVKTVEAAIGILTRSMRDDTRCNSSFTRLSGRKDFKTLFDDRTIWINYDPSNNGKKWGWCMPGRYPRDIVVTEYTLRIGKWATAATIVHELAHLNGASGEKTSEEAELRVKACQMQSANGPYDPDIGG